MKRLLTTTALALIAAMAMGTTAANPFVPGSNQFCLYDNLGGFISSPNWGTDCDEQVTGSLDPIPATGAGNVIESPQLFFNQPWNAHDIITYAPGSYTVDTCNPGATPPDCGTYNFTVNAGQTGASMLFDWGAASGTTPCGQANCDIDVVLVWDATINAGDTQLVSTDWDDDGILGGAMIDGPFVGSSANFDLLVQGDIRPAPEAVDDNGGSALNDETKTIDLTGNDVFYPAVVVNLCGTDCGAPNLSTTAGGTLVDNLDGTVDYTAPSAPFLGADTFLYTITDDTGLTSAQATVTVTVTAVANTAPVANDVDFNTDEEVDLVINVTDTDDNGTPVATDAEGDSLTFSTFGQGTSGAVALDGTSTMLTYTPDPDFNGSDSFTFSVNDGIDNSNTATVTVTVNPVNDPLTCTDVSTSTQVDTALDIDVAADLLSTCTDPDTGDTISLDSTTQPTQGGTLSFDGANTLTYTPASGFEGQDTFTYTATDGTVTDTRTVTVNVTSAAFGNFTMLDAGGSTFGGTNDIVYEWDGSLNTAVDSTNFNMIMGSASTFPFFGFPWFAHNIRVFGPGSYDFDTTCSVAQLEAGVANCGGGPDDMLNLTIPAGQIGAHVLFDWNVTENIDVILLWEENASFDNPPPGALYQGPAGTTPAPDSVFRYVSRDADGDGTPGGRMIDGPFIGFRANFNLENLSAGGEVVVPVSTIDSPSVGGSCSLARGKTSAGADWLLLAGFIGLLGWARRRSSLH